MLVLSRKVGESVLIGDNIRVTLVAIRGEQVRLGFTAPNEVRILRHELTQDAATQPSQETYLAMR